MAQGKHALLIGINAYPLLPNRDLRGCLHDVEVMGELLARRFGFPADSIQRLVGSDATRDGILDAFDALRQRVVPGDAVVLYYAGHGSRLRDPGRPDDDVIIESLVPCDSGRDTAPNRDILDREVDAFVRLLSAATDNVTLIFDCCHSGSVTRSAGGVRSRRVEPDLRSAQAMGRVDEALTRSVSSLAEPKGASGWLPRSRAVLLAACRADELANEHRGFDSGSVVHHGAFTYHLVRALERAPGAATWRDVFERVAPAVHSVHRRQHPQLEGPRDRKLFGSDVVPPSRSVTVVGVEGQRVVLGAGAAHGVARGARYAIDPATESGAPLAHVSVTEVGATRAWASIDEGELDAIAPGQRALALQHSLPVLALRVALDANVGSVLAGVIDASHLVDVVDDRADADVVLSCVDGTWQGVGADGRFAVRSRADGPGVGAALLGDLEAVARFRNLSRLYDAAPPSPLAGRVRLTIKRAVAGGPMIDAAAEDDGGLVTFEEGDRAEFIVHNDAAEDVFVTLLELGTDGAVAVLYPDPDFEPYRTESQRVAAGGQLAIAADHYGMPGGLPLTLPEGFPWAAEPAEQADGGLLTVSLLVTRRPTDFSRLAQGAVRSLSAAAHPLQGLVAALGGGTASRSFKPRRPAAGKGDDWTVVTRSVAVHRREPGQALDPSGAPVASPGGVVVRAPGLAGVVRFRRDGARTRAVIGAHDDFSAGLADVGVTTIVDITLSDTREMPTRALRAIPTTREGEPALTVKVPNLGAGWVAAIVSRDESGFVRWVFGTRSDDGDWEFLVGRQASESDGSTRSLWGSVLRGVRRVLRVVAWSTADLVGAGAALAFEAWERTAHRHRLRSFEPDTYGLSEGFATIGADAWRRLSAGPALLVVHGTLSSVAEGFAELPRWVVAELHRRYEGRVFALDHPTVSVDPEVNVRWLVDQMPTDARLTLDIVGHSRGGLVSRALAAWGPDWSGGRLAVRRVICVGTPNRGTRLTDTESSEGFLTIMTHAVNTGPRWAVRLGLSGIAAVAKLLFMGMARNLAGLQAMHPEGDFLPRLGAAEDAAPPVSVFAISADYRAPEDDSGLSGLQRFASVLHDSVFQEPNDLVVPTDGVHGQCPGPHFPVPAARYLLLASADSERGEEPWHNAFFGRPDVCRQLLQWLGT